MRTYLVSVALLVSACSQQPTTPVSAADAFKADGAPVVKAGPATLTLHLTGLDAAKVAEVVTLAVDVRQLPDAKSVSASTAAIKFAAGQATVAEGFVANGGPYVVSVQGFTAGSATPTWHGRVPEVKLAGGQKLTVDVLLVPLEAIAAVAAPQTPGGLFSAAVGIDNGRVLLTGGFTTDLATPSDKAWIFDGGTGVLQATATMKAPRAGHSMVYLPKSNRVLVMGGTVQMTLAADGKGPPQWSKGAAVGYEVFDVATGQFTAPAAEQSAIKPRVFPNLVTLPGEKVVAMAGAPWPTYLTNAYAYSDVFDVGGAAPGLADGCADDPAALLMEHVRAGAAMARLDAPGTPRYLLWGGATRFPFVDKTNVLPTVPHLVDRLRVSPTASLGDFYPDYVMEGDTLPPNPPEDKSLPQPTLLFAAVAPLPRIPIGGKDLPQLLAVGGARYGNVGGGDVWMVPHADDAYVLSVQEPTPTAAGRLIMKRVNGTTAGRIFHQATAVDGGEVVVSGGIGDFGGAAVAGLDAFEGVVWKWKSPAQLPAAAFAPRFGHTATRMANGCVLFAGGTSAWSPIAVGPLQIYCPKSVLTPPLPLAPAPLPLPAPTLQADKPLKIDLLLVMDHSSSMCQEQRMIASGAGALLTKLDEQAKALGAAGADVQVAVTTVQQVPDSKVILKVGRFVHAPAQTLPPSCIEKVKYPCLKDADCNTPICFPYFNFDPEAPMCPKNGEKCLTPPQLTKGNYRCKSNTDTPTFNNNYNCSVNTSCQLQCSTDADCYALFEPSVGPGNHRVFCNKVVSPAGCMFMPKTANCPAVDVLPPILKQSVATKVTFDDGSSKDGTQLDWLRCNATVGANQEPEALFEGGLRAAWQALDPRGPNCPHEKDGTPTGPCQNLDFVRPDALLAIVVVSDDDDCSINFELDPYIGDISSEDQRKTFDNLYAKELQRSCQSYGDAIGGNLPLLYGYCAKLQSSDAKAGKPKRMCPQDCVAMPDKSGDAYQKCAAAAESTLQKLIEDNPGNMISNWRFSPVAHFANRFRSLKADPAHVVFGVVTGDSLVSDKNGKTMDQTSYYTSVLTNTAGVQSVYACSGIMGESGYGARYMSVATAFGCHGLRRNICKFDPNDAAGWYGELGTAIVTAFSKPN